MIPATRLPTRHFWSKQQRHAPRHSARESGNQLVLRPYWTAAGTTGWRSGAASLSTLPCATPFLSTGYVNNSNLSTSCKEVQSYTRTAPARNFMPTERLSFQSTYIPRLEMSASASYSNSNNGVANLYDSINEWTTSTTSQIRDSIVSGPANANEIFAHANWSGHLLVNPKTSARRFRSL